MRVQFFRRREICFPTAWGWLAIAALLAASCALFVRAIHPFLAQRAPVDARILVVEGWLGPAELAEAATIFRSGRYEHVVTTGSPIYGAAFDGLPYQTLAERAADHLARRGVPRERISAVPAPDTDTNRTYESAVSVRRWAERAGYTLDSVDVVSDGAHARRSRLLFELAMPGTSVGVLSTRPHDYDPDAWWRTTAGTKEILSQALGFAWVKCCFWPHEGRTAESGRL